jgi:hypothetical protein
LSRRARAHDSRLSHLQRDNGSTDARWRASTAVKADPQVLWQIADNSVAIPYTVNASAACGLYRLGTFGIQTGSLMGLVRLHINDLHSAAGDLGEHHSWL